jgi:son of sevenless-like protein
MADVGLESSFFQAFMLTFRSFVSGDRLLELLSERFDVPPPAGMNEMEHADWTKSKQTPIRLR